MNTHRRETLRLASKRAWALRWRNRQRSREAAARVYEALSASADDDTVVLQELLGQALHILAWHAKWLGDFAAAESYGSEALRRLEGTEGRIAMADTLSTLAVVKYSRGDHTGAHRLVAEGLEAITELPPNEAKVDLLVTLSTLHQYSKDFEKCFEYLTEALRLARSSGFSGDVPRIIHNRARAERNAGQYACSEASAREALAETRRVRNRVIEPYVLEVAAAALIATGRANEALSFLIEGEALALVMGDRRAQCQILELAGEAALDLNRPDQARSALQRGLQTADKVGYPLWQQRFNLDLSRTYEVLGCHREALQHFKRYSSIHEAMFSEDNERRLADLRTQLEYREAKNEVTLERNQREMLERAKSELETTHAKLANAYKLIEYNAYHDALTGLPNRRYFEKMLTQASTRAARGGPCYAVLQIDLDGFKQVNDTLGHAAGDHILVEVAKTLNSLARNDDFVARIGGDELVVLSTSEVAPEELSALAERIIFAVNRPISFESHICRIGASIGIACGKDSPTEPQRRLVHADIALYRAKRNGRNRYEFFSKRMQTELNETKKLADAILRGVEQRAFIPFYQPQFDAQTLTLSGVEALARWRHPEKGILEPSIFLTMAEDLDVIATIDRLILDQALYDLDRWRAAGFDVPRVSVNISAKRLHDQLLVQSLQNRSIPKGALAFELVESILLDDDDAVLGTNIEHLKEMGIDIEIDDFGTGHASISSLIKVQPQRLKIDRSLVMPVTASTKQLRLVEAIFGIGRLLQIDVTAEGVETSKHADILRDLGCHTLQGFALAKPMTADDLMQQVNDGTLPLASRAKMRAAAGPSRA